MRSKRRIDATLPDAVQYLYILHKSGANQYEAVKSLSENAAYFGDAATEFSRVISDTELGIGIHEALKHLSLDTPSKKLRRFVAGYAASVRTTGDAVPYLEDMVSSMREEQRILQEKYLSSLGVFAEIYLTLFVAGPLFAVIAGMVLGIISSADTLGLSAIIYAVLPLGAVAYLILLDSMDSTVSIPHRNFSEPKVFAGSAAVQTAGEEKQFASLKAYEKRRMRNEISENPFRYFIEYPERIFCISLPLGILFTLPITENPYLWTAVFLLTVFVPFAVFYTLQTIRQRKAEASVPDFCRRTSEYISQGMTLADSVCLAAENETGILKREVKRVSSEIIWGDTAVSALIRFANRIRLSSVNRMVILIKESGRFSSDASDMLSLNASEEKKRFLSAENRRNSMSMYTVIIYLAYFVFLFVTVVMLTVFLEAMSVTSVPTEIYETLLVNAVLIHGICSGIAAGKLAEESVFAGVKHACIMFAAGTVVFLALGIV